MIRATQVRPQNNWSEAAADTVVLDFDDRHRRRIAMVGVRGIEFLLDLPEAVMLRGGDGLLLEDGRLVEVVAAPEPLVEVRGKAAGDLVRLAWHIGNRHLPAQMSPNAIRLRRDHVIEEMLRGLGARLVPIEAPFDPEGGAYAAAPKDAEHDHDRHHGHHHHKHDDHAHHEHGAHDHKHDHGPKHDHASEHEDRGHDPKAHAEHGHKHGHDNDHGKHGHKHHHD